MVTRIRTIDSSALKTPPAPLGKAFEIEITYDAEIKDLELTASTRTPGYSARLYRTAAVTNEEPVRAGEGEERTMKAFLLIRRDKKDHVNCAIVCSIGALVTASRTPCTPVAAPAPTQAAS